MHGFQTEPEKTLVDVKIDEIAAYITVLEKQLEAVLKHSENLVKKSGDNAVAHFDLSQSLSGLGQTEGEDIGRVLTEVCLLTRLCASTLSYALPY